ncbi:MAG: hypothetical protein ACP6IQ_04560 [Candidatus Njordarchaeia archaeon]
MILIPIIAVSKERKWSLVLLLTAVLYGSGALLGLVANPTWPVKLRIIHGLEIAVDSFFQNYASLKILGKFGE